MLQKYPQDTINQTVITKDTDNFHIWLSGRHFISKFSDQKGPTSKLTRQDVLHVRNIRSGKTHDMNARNVT
jgi:hypothetical protein